MNQLVYSMVNVKIPGTNVSRKGQSFLDTGKKFITLKCTRTLWTPCIMLFIVAAVPKTQKALMPGMTQLHAKKKADDF